MASISPNKKNVALVLSSGGARGLAHIGVIDELCDRGYNITSIAGSSMGAFVGGLYATGNLDKFKDWVINLDKLNILKLVDFTLSKQGFIRGEKVFEKMQELKMIPDVNIEDLPLKYTAIATDIINNKEVVFESGDLHKAIRASISIPNIFTPVEHNDTYLVDGGVLNPLPLNRVAKADGDIVIAVDVNSIVPYERPILPPTKKELEKLHKEKLSKISEKWDSLFNHGNSNGLDKSEKKSKIGYFEILVNTIQLMQYKLSNYSIEKYPPDVLVNISKNSGSIFEFYKGTEFIAYGREACSKALAEKGL